MYDKVAEWLEDVLKQNIHDEVGAFYFNLHDDGDVEILFLK